MLIKNIKITNIDQQYLGWCEINEQGIIVALNQGETNQPGIDGHQAILMPSFIDSHTHGGYGLSFDHADQNNWIEQYYQYEHQLNYEGVGYVFATTVTQSIAQIYKLAQAYSEILNNYQTAILTWYLEGPFIAKKQKGAHNEHLIIPLKQTYLNYLKQFKYPYPLVITIAPEQNKNGLIATNNSADFLFAIGHSDCWNVSTTNWMNQTCTRITHLFNAMNGFHHRNEGLVNTIFQQKHFAPKFNIEIIGDGHHVTNPTLHFTYKNLPKNNLVVVSDCLSAKGLADGDYYLDQLPITKKGDLCYLTNTNNLAGSTMPFHLVLKNFKEATNCSWSELVYFSSYNVAQQLQINYLGTIQVGIKANLVLLTEQFEILQLWRNGKLVLNQI